MLIASQSRKPRRFSEKTPTRPASMTNRKRAPLAIGLRLYKRVVIFEIHRHRAVAEVQKQNSAFPSRRGEVLRCPDS